MFKMQQQNTRSNAISRLHTLCIARRWGRPIFDVDEQKQYGVVVSYRARVKVHGVSYDGVDSATSNAARVEAALAALRCLDAVVVG